MSKVQITIAGRQALVDEDQAQLLKRKEELIAEAQAAKAHAGELGAVAALVEMDKIVSEIIQLNRKIRPNVQFI
jgi:hypothetical protein